MSLEQAISDNTAAIKELLACWTRLTANAVAIKADAAIVSATIGGAVRIPVGADTASTAATTTEAAPAPAPAPAAKAPKAEAKKPAPTPPAEETKVAAPEPAMASPSEVTYDMVAAAINAKVKTDRAGVIAALAEFGVRRGPELKVEQYAGFLKALG